MSSILTVTLAVLGLVVCAQMAKGDDADDRRKLDMLRQHCFCDDLQDYGRGFPEPRCACGGHYGQEGVNGCCNIGYGSCFDFCSGEAVTDQCKLDENGKLDMPNDVAFWLRNCAGPAVYHGHGDGETAAPLPEDASDVTTLEEARKELSRLRSVFQRLLSRYDVVDGFDHKGNPTVSVGSDDDAKGEEPVGVPVSPSGDVGEEEEGEVNCDNYLSCDSCLGKGCAWCRASRKCVPDKAWQCQGDTDHIGAVGTSQSCQDEKDRLARLREGRLQRLAQHAEKQQEKQRQRLAASSSGPGPGENDPSMEGARQRAQHRANQRNLEELNRVRDELHEGDDETPSSDAATAEQEKRKAAERQKELSELKQNIYDRAAASEKDGGGSQRPYDVLAVELTASQSQIRKIYRKLSLKFHPDKIKAAFKASHSGEEVKEIEEAARKAFADIVAAYEILNNPDKRAAFDDFGSESSTDGFETFWEYEQYGKGKHQNDFYTGDPLITTLSERLWERRVTGSTIWIIELYAPWCVHCKNFVPQFKQVAQLLKDEDVEVGAINCEKDNNLCTSMFNVRSYPSIRMVNAKEGTQQELPGDSTLKSDPVRIAKWTRDVAVEWRWLYALAQLHIIDSSNFTSSVIQSEDFWILAFVDGFDCAPCKTAKTNMLRLSAGLRGMAQVGIVNCEAQENREFCYQHQGVPASPHAPQVKAWRRGDKMGGLDVKRKQGNDEDSDWDDEEGDEYDEEDGEDKGLTVEGEVLYNANEVESHVALEICERAVRLSLSSTLVGDDAVSTGERPETTEFQRDKKEDDPPPPPPRPRKPMWNGPSRPMRVAWDGARASPHHMLGHGH